MKALRIIKDILREWSFIIICLVVTCLIISLFYTILAPIVVIIFGLIFTIYDKLGWIWSLTLLIFIAILIEFIRRYKRY